MSHSDEDIMPVPEPISDASSKTSGESVEPKPDESETTGEKFPVMQTGVTSALQSFLEEHKEQSKVVQAVKNELTRLDKTPDEYFESRKKFLFHAYTQTLKDCPHTSEFDVKLDALFSIADLEVGRVFGNIYHINAQDALEETFTFQRADIVNKETAERVAKWQTMGSPPEGHSIPLMEIGKQILEGDKEDQNIEPVRVATETSNLVEEANELAEKEARLNANFPAAAKILNLEAETSSRNSSSTNSTMEVGHESESSGILVDKEECVTPVDESEEDVPVSESETDKMASTKGKEDEEQEK